MRTSPRTTALASLAALLCAGPVEARGAHGPLPIYFEDDHAGALELLAARLDLDRPHALVLVDAHPDSSTPRGLEALRQGLRRVASPEEREARIQGWRREGAVQSFDWIHPLVPRPISQVLWVCPAPACAGDGSDAPGAPLLPPMFTRVRLDDLATRLPPDLPVAVSIDLDAFTGLSVAEQASRFADVWSRVVRLPRLAAITFAISRPWLADDDEASRLVLLALRAGLSLAHAGIRFEPWGIEGPDRSERAKLFYREGREPPRFDPGAASAELRSLLLASADRLDVRLDPARWRELLDRWRAESGAWSVTVSGVEADSDHVFRPPAGARPELRVEGGPPGRVRGVTWLRWTPRVWAYSVLPDLPKGKVFAGAAPPVVEYEATVLARTTSPILGAEIWMAALPRPDRSGVLRVSADIETDDGLAHTARIELRRGIGSGFRAGLSEQFGLPYVFGAGFLRSGGLGGPDTGVGNDCANFLVAAWRRSGLRMPWSNPAQLRRHLTRVAEGVRASDHIAIPGDADDRGLVVHLGSHVAALWEDRAPFGVLGEEDLVVHHLGDAPDVISLGALLRGRDRSTFDVYLGPSREVDGWIAVGGDLMPGAEGPSPAGLRERLRSADLAVANLETTAGDAGRPVAKRYVFRITSARLKDVRDLGVRAVSLANNHAGDFGPEGLRGTVAALDAEGLGHFGAGADVPPAVSAWYGRVGGVDVAFLAVSLTDADAFQAGPGRTGVAALPGHERELADAIAAARARARTVIVLPHWGVEGSPTVTEEQRRRARWLVDRGVDAVVGSGPHVVQGHEMIAGVPVYYSVGNLWFDGPWSPAARIAGIAWLGVNRGGRIVESRLERGDATAGGEASP
ncbi:CapA family protein [Anaeromyxobacter oryzisoli]|uniref:CapA family protein n=1 Tax=Anaeromyxobacter oryzisoli TaxID=2925408 RepID=UPI001F57E566|nr:CapA family protein [Anaeromyxobacter sp. SG63]